MEPLVSVVIPTYKRPTALKRAIDSVLNQEYKNIEIFVVDDNNSNTPEREETEQFMRSYADEPRVTYVKHEMNKNGSAARNTGWRLSSGKYITYIDDDDEISPEKIGRQVECLEALDDSFGACYTAYRLIKPDGSYQISSESRSGNVYLYALMRTMFMGSGSNLLLRKCVVDEIGGYDESFKRNQDIEFMARALENYKLAYIDEPLLTIHQDAFRPTRTYEQLDSYSQHYLSKFEDRLNALSKKDRKKVISVISLERARTAFVMKEYKAAWRLIWGNRVSLLSCIRYMWYLFHRVITHKSYGFYL